MDASGTEFGLQRYRGLHVANLYGSPVFLDAIASQGFDRSVELDSSRLLSDEQYATSGTCSTGAAGAAVRAAPFKASAGTALSILW